jgi:sulfoacetaldehyde acetyltransferase
MELIAKADVVLALGTRLNPFSTLPGYGIDYWPKTRRSSRSTSTRTASASPRRSRSASAATPSRWRSDPRTALAAGRQCQGRAERKALIHQTKSAWLQTLSSMDHEDDDPGTSWNADARRATGPAVAAPGLAGDPGRRCRDAIISTDIGNNCAIGNAYPTFDKGRKYLAPGLFGPCGYGFPSIIGAKIGCPDVPVVGFAGDGAFGISMSEMTSIGREEWPGITMVIFRNYQWGAEKRNSILWYDNNFVGTELDPDLSYAKVAEAAG